MNIIKLYSETGQGTKNVNVTPSKKIIYAPLMAEWSRGYKVGELINYLL